MKPATVDSVTEAISTYYPRMTVDGIEDYAGYLIWLVSQLGVDPDVLRETGHTVEAASVATDVVPLVRNYVHNLDLADQTLLRDRFTGEIFVGSLMDAYNYSYQYGTQWLNDIYERNKLPTSGQIATILDGLGILPVYGWITRAMMSGLDQRALTRAGLVATANDHGAVVVIPFERVDRLTVPLADQVELIQAHFEAIAPTVERLAHGLNDQFHAIREARDLDAADYARAIYAWMEKNP